MNIPNYLFLCEKYKKLLATLVIVFLLSTLYSPQLAALQISVPQNVSVNEDEPNYDGYIIKFNEEPLSTSVYQLRDELKNILLSISETFADKILVQKALQYKDKILSDHRKAKEDILKLIENGSYSETIFSEEFTNLFNGLTIKKISDSVLKKIKELPYVSNVYPNYKLSICLDESIPLINADDVWKLHDSYNRNITGKNITIAFLDTGVDYNHPDLKDNFIGGYDFVNNDSDPMDDHIRGHGTHCAGIAVGKGNESNYKYVGVAPDAKFYAYKILNESGIGNTSSFLAGMDRAIDPNNDGDFSDHVDIISISAGDDSGNPDDPLSLAADNAVDIGVVVVAAAGNNGPGKSTIVSPGCAQKVICVGATDKYDRIYDRSSRGPTSIGMVKPDVVAPGVNIKSTKLGGGYIYLTGTSMATPHVAGAAALLMQACPNFTTYEVKITLINTAFDLGYDENTQGSGRINVLRAVKPEDEELIIKCPNEVNEGDFFTVSITNGKGKPVKACILFTTPFHLPRFKYGSEVWFKAPLILNRRTEEIHGKIIVFKIVGRYRTSKDITVLNNRFFPLLKPQ